MKKFPRQCKCTSHFSSYAVCLRQPNWMSLRSCSVPLQPQLLSWYPKTLKEILKLVPHAKKRITQRRMKEDHVCGLHSSQHVHYIYKDVSLGLTLSVSERQEAFFSLNLYNCHQTFVPFGYVHYAYDYGL